VTLVGEVGTADHRVADRSYDASVAKLSSSQASYRSLDCLPQDNVNTYSFVSSSTAECSTSDNVTRRL
jgi:hypothetical protein